MNNYTSKIPQDDTYFGMKFNTSLFHIQTLSKSVVDHQIKFFGTKVLVEVVKSAKLSILDG